MSSSTSNRSLKAVICSVLCSILVAWQPGSREVQAEEIVAQSALLRLIDDIRIPATKVGLLAKVHVTEGQKVQAGDEVALIDDFESELLLQRAELELELAIMQIKNDVSVRIAETELAFSKQNFDRLKRASDTLAGSVSKSEVAALEHAYQKATLSLEDAKRLIELAKENQRIKENDVMSMRRRVAIQRITSPISGTVELVKHRAGEWVEPGEEIVRVVSRKRIRAEGFVDSAFVQQDLTGSRVELETEYRQKSKFTGKITFVHSEVDPVNRRMRVWAEVENPKDVLRPGMRAKMIIFPHEAKAN